MNRINVEQMCNNANKIFINESLSGYVKYTYLPHWLKNKSTYLSRERSNQNRNFRVYKRGTIIYVDFGVNVGNELSGNHFAIVLNNKDNLKNGVLNVIPISSKDKSCYLPLDEIINLQSIKYLISESDKINHRVRILLTIGINNKTISETVLENESVNDLYTSSPAIPLEEAMEKATQYGFHYENKEKISGSVESLLAESKQLHKVFTAYQKYTKKCYAMPLNIQSVSKWRIKKINRFDPTGKMKAPSEVMDKIDDSIIQHFTKVKY